jgi:peptidoglycan/LPS O-acetylase OafA/YrhL
MPGVAYTLPYFAGGAAMFVFVSRFGTHRWLALASLLLLFCSAFVGVQHYAFAVFGAYLVVFLGERHNPASSFARRFGDWSYGLFLFGWPIEQLIHQWSETNDGFLLFLYSLPVALLVAAISWLAVEKPSLELKKRLGRLLSRPRGTITSAPTPTYWRRATLLRGS